MEGSQVTRSPGKRGCASNIFPNWVLILYLMILMDFFSSFWRFYSFLGDLGPFLRPDLGGKLGDGYHIQAYIN
jgi:hypothetical protein